MIEKFILDYDEGDYYEAKFLFFTTIIRPLDDVFA